MGQGIRILAIHGIAHQEARKPQWQPDWERAISSGIRGWAPDAAVEVQFFDFDDLFAEAPFNPLVIARALRELFGGLIAHGTADMFRSGRSMGDWLDAQRWCAGMVAQWASDPRLRARLRSRLARAIVEFAPDAVCAHSLGSLLAYDTIIWPGENAAMADRTFVSFGSQIGFPAVRGIYGGFIRPIECRMWYHLYNPRDDVLTAPIRLRDARFTEIVVEFEQEGVGDHDGGLYLGHPATRENVWRALASRPTRGTRQPNARRKARPSQTMARHPNRRALLVGINEYPDPTKRLDGCVNDAFLMSATLQECGFAAEDIRLVTDSRATARGIRRRLEWLLGGAADGDQRVFFYAGHGSQLAGYGAGETIDRLDECLVPWDFDGSRETAICDDDFFDLYAQLPYGVHFAAIFDCCHSGGMARPAGAKIRTISPPDDIRHRSLRWDTAKEMWLARDLAPHNRDLLKYHGLVTSSGARRIGSGVAARQLRDSDYDRVRRELGHRGPYWPLLLFACGEQELAGEYHHGPITYGAFTFALVKTLRDHGKANREISFGRLVEKTARLLRCPDLGFDQTPAAFGPASKLKAPVPWRSNRPGPRQSPRR
ncbi:MAG TPA: caspase family protein [Verrucomicrobiae bacterium]|nr:caspase family protein [Verrucomicrobiae bacterium]